MNKSKLINEIAFVIPKNNNNNSFYKEIKKRSIKVFRGSEKNVLNRYFKASQYYKSDIIVRITGDCPLVDHELVDTMLKKFLKIKLTLCQIMILQHFLMDLI